MKIIVCVKQVPDTTEIKIDPVTNTLIRAGVPSIVNPYDAYALETALRLKERYGAEVLVISMGPEQAKEALKECLAVGADRAWLISDRAFGGNAAAVLAAMKLCTVPGSCVAEQRAGRRRTDPLRQTGDRRRYGPGWTGDGGTSGPPPAYLCIRCRAFGGRGFSETGE